MKATSGDSVGATLAAALWSAAKGNSHTAVTAAAVLWPDKEGQWQAALPALKRLMPGLCVLGPYDPGQRSGPAVWLKCAIAGLLPEVRLDGVPVIYLPGVGRSDLRAIETCPRDLQPLAELQYRGVFWSQANARDWTITAFLASRNGGLGLDVAQDKATQEAIGQLLAAGELLERSLDEFEGRQINAEWLYSLLAPNPARDLLVWINDPVATQREWNGVRWQVFVRRCQSDFGFHPETDGILVAAEKLARRAGKWAAVAELYRDSHPGFPQVFQWLNQVQPPQLELFDDTEALAGYPQANEEREAALRYVLSACADMAAEQARDVILNAEQSHAARRRWLWAQMGQAPLATALGHLKRLADSSTVLPGGTQPHELARSYQQTGWQVDDAAVQALAAVQSRADLDAVSGALRAVYLPWLEEAAQRLQQAVQTAGGLPPLDEAASSDLPSAGLCTVFVDGLRYDTALRLKERLDRLGSTSIGARWTSLPSVTASGKARCSPVAALIAGNPQDTDFEPRVAGDGKPLSAHNFRKLLSDNGIQPLDRHATGTPQGTAWTEAGDLDHYGHQHGIRLARDLDPQLGQILERVAELGQAGWQRFRIVTDHGWLLLPGGLPKTALPRHQTEARWGRCAVLRDSAHGTPLTFGWDWCPEVQVAYAPGVACFVAGTEYAHGGISLQECLVPVINLELAGPDPHAIGVSIQSVHWKGLRCVVEVESDATDLTVDIRTRPALASSSLAYSSKPVQAGKASLAVADDGYMDTAAVVVVLNAAGEVVQRQATTVGG